jgi:DNA-binding winged helix-turn-helix (wHTH) protein
VETFGSGRFRIDRYNRLLYDGDRKISPSALAFDLLLYLADHSDRIIKRDTLADDVWHDHEQKKKIPFNNAIDIQISRLRRILDDKKGTKYIETCRGTGYRWIAGAPKLVPLAQEIILAPGEPAAPPKSTRSYVPVALAVVALALLGGFSHTLRPGAPVQLLPLTAEPGDESDPGLSPDGTRVIYATTGGITAQFFSGDGQPWRLTSPGRYWSPKWSPDGKWIAFLREVRRGVHNVVLIASGGGPERVLATSEGVSLAWSPDSKFVVIADVDPRLSGKAHLAISRVSIDTGARVQVTHPPDDWWGDISSAYSPDGKLLAFIRYPAAEQECSKDCGRSHCAGRTTRTPSSALKDARFLPRSRPPHRVPQSSIRRNRGKPASGAVIPAQALPPISFGQLIPTTRRQSRQMAKPWRSSRTAPELTSCGSAIPTAAIPRA